MFKIGDEVIVSPDDVDSIICDIFKDVTRGVVVKEGTSSSNSEVYLYRYKKSEIFNNDQLTLCEGQSHGAGCKIYVSIHDFEDQAGVKSIQFGVLERAELGYFMGRLVKDDSPFCYPENHIFIESDVPGCLPIGIDEMMIKRVLVRNISGRRDD